MARCSSTIGISSSRSRPMREPSSRARHMETRKHENTKTRFDKLTTGACPERVEGWFRGFVVSWFRGFAVSWFRGFVVSWLRFGLCLSPLWALSLSAQTPSANWNQFRGNARLTGVATTAPPDALKLRWTYEAGESIESSAAIVDGAVYVGSSKGELLAIDLETGKLRWKYATGEAGFIGESSPAVSDGVVFVGDLAGLVHAVDARDGKRLWTFKTDGEGKSSAAVAGDMVLVGSYDTYLYALDRRTGKPRWKLQTDGPVHATPAVHNGVIYIAGCDETFRAVRVADGKVLFEIPLGAYTGASTL